MKLGQYDLADDEFNKAMTIFESAKDESGVGKYRVQYNKGINYRHMNMLNESIEWFSKAVDDPNNKDKSAAYNYRGLSNFEIGQF